MSLYSIYHVKDTDSYQEKYLLAIDFVSMIFFRIFVQYGIKSTDMPIGVDIFSGAGGLSLGADMSGIQISIKVEKDFSAAKTYRHNHPGTLVLQEDIHNINPTDYIGLADEPVFIVFGGPPCQGFSKSNTKTRTSQNPNNSLFEEFIRFVKELNPEWFLFENVEGIIGFDHGKTLERIKECFRQLHYEVACKVLTASEYGVPQNRNRFIMVGNRLGIRFEFPEGIASRVTVSDAISDLPELDNGQMSDSLPYRCLKKHASSYARQMRNGSRTSKQNYVSRNADYVIRRYAYIHQGENWRAIPGIMMQNYANTKNCHSGIYKRLVADKPSVVISNYRKNMLIHPYQDRGLSVREAARLQSFPDNYIFKGTLMHMQQQIGNAVPPLLAKAVFNKIMEYGRRI